MKNQQMPPPQQGSEKKELAGSKESTLSQTLNLATKPPSHHGAVVALFVLVVLTTVCVVVAAIVIAFIEGAKGSDEGTSEVTIIDYKPSVSKLGNYSHWAAATDAMACAGASRWMYKNGGNAIDAAVASLLCNTLVLPASSGIGGGFVATIYSA
ncbi:hypothetical protein HPB49_002274 [Dermacentor silvarum]|uniref:Uncharacterized protein n=1 Tax=Dermacentor silvarum TaxID=543639 RepID=A0ACB8DA29_DERSI|nr:hypothetical protein HPB49_002274 [Dermacentor silvarum]